MIPSKNKPVQIFLEELEGADPDKYQLIQTMRSIVFDHNPAMAERIMYGGIMFRSSEDWGGLFVSKKHVSFEFGKGFSLSDPKNILEGTGKFRRHLKVRCLEDIENKYVKRFVEQIH